MILIRCQQGTPEWHSARVGVITASMFGVARSRVGVLTEQQQTFVDSVQGGASEKDAAALAGYKAVPRSGIITRALAGLPVGDFSEAAKDYAFRIAAERIGGVALDDGFSTWAMKRGHELEPEARREHEVQSGLIVREVGFITTDDGVFGASVDGLIGEYDGAEYKCFVDPGRLRKFYIDDDASEVMDQAAGGMWITGRKRWHVAQYCPALRPANKHLWAKVFPRDDDYIERLERDLMEFKALVDQYEARLRGEELATMKDAA